MTQKEFSALLFEEGCPPELITDAWAMRPSNDLDAERLRWAAKQIGGRHSAFMAMVLLDLESSERLH